jgi:hypothetical protein
MYTTKLTMEERLLEADVAISNALADEIIMKRRCRDRYFIFYIFRDFMQHVTCNM